VVGQQKLLNANSTCAGVINCPTMAFTSELGATVVLMYMAFLSISLLN
jgi:hypothetical protein